MRKIFFAVFFFFMACFGHASDMRNAAIEYNNIGFSLYEEGRYAESLYYFETSILLDSQYVYPHYNYACVLSLLMEDNVDRWAPYMEVLSEHLLISFLLDSGYRAKYLQDDDLKWFRENASEYDELVSLHLFKANTDKALIKEKLVSQRWQTVTTDGSPAGTMNFWRNNTLSLHIGNSRVTGSYQIAGNIVYLFLDEPFQLLQGDAFQEMILLLNLDNPNSFRFLRVPHSFRRIQSY